MRQLSKTEYLQNPCSASSLPYWKHIRTAIPGFMRIVHHTQFDAAEFPGYTDDLYFRLRHDLETLNKPLLPEGYRPVCASAKALAGHINSCYPDCRVTEEELLGYQNHPVYDASLWIALADEKSGEIAASGIAEFDCELREGVLEWIQVSPTHRRKGLGTFVVEELLWRMREKADFVTVSGKVNNETNPEALYRACGFTGNDIWHILTVKEKEMEV